MRSFTLALSMAAAVAVSVLAGCGKPPEAAGGPQASPVGVVAAVVRPVREIEEFTGRLEALESVDLRPRIGGTVDKVHFRDGAMVRAGELLFTIDPRPYAAEVARAESQVAAAVSQGELAKSELARAQKLLDARAVSRQEFDQLSSGALTSDASLQAARAALRIARLNVEYTRVTAPISGRVSRANITAGNLVDDKTVLTSIVALQKVYAYFDASERTFLSRRMADRNTVVVRMGLADEDGFPHTGSIDFVDNRLNTSTGSIRMRAVFDNARGTFVPGLFARVVVTSGAPTDRVLIPDRAIGTDQTKKFVYVVGADNTPQYRPVMPGTLQDGMRVIDSGLKAGELVVVDGLQRVRPGMPVTPETLAVDERGMPKPPLQPGAPGAPETPAAPASAASAASAA